MTIVLRDFTHASKIFRGGGLYDRAPKVKFLFHVYFSLNQNQYLTGNLGSITQNDPFGVLVKTVKLPSFQLTTHELNQYNRKRIVQTKIKYEPVELTFHDDASNTITKLWETYYTYYYKDSTNYNNSQFNGKPGYIPPPNAGSSLNETRNIYKQEITNQSNWGFIGETAVQTGIYQSFFRNITIFGFDKHRFTAYTLVNPIINRMSHDTYNYSEGGGTMEISMSINYESVIYNQGAMAGSDPSNIVQGFGLDAYYDKTTAPGTIPGQQNAVQGNAGTITAQQNPRGFMEGP